MVTKNSVCNEGNLVLNIEDRTIHYCNTGKMLAKLVIMLLSVSLNLTTPSKNIGTATVKTFGFKMIRYPCLHTLEFHLSFPVLNNLE